MNHAPLEAVPDHRLPSAQSQGFAHVMVVPFSDPYSTGPLTASADLVPPARPHGLRRASIAGCPEPAAG
ncbi:hypothetical protein W911_16695 [Hyphomicrobium nitrativorans NL23]|uniref:Uncharacterized protein n=1 Tax=Hyphomicrobium nitrativorans NL23 TaxID=1029756 RepID=V5SIV9_9HYPH|nr:hypothetical protein [Hyphomicrobium nitrativorans]AHB50427.1 hypothetical protein W911_16695 [Hyphomicrobium nitrativorans NL23]